MGLATQSPLQRQEEVRLNRSSTGVRPADVHRRRQGARAPAAPGEGQRNCGSSTLSMTQTVPLVVRTAVQSATDWLTAAPVPRS